MPSAVLPTISADEIDDLLYLARTNDIHDLKAGIDAIARAQRTSSENVILATIDPENGNGLLHMASANGCLGMLYIFSALQLAMDSAYPYKISYSSLILAN